MAEHQRLQAIDLDGAAWRSTAAGDLHRYSGVCLWCSRAFVPRVASLTVVRKALLGLRTAVEAALATGGEDAVMGLVTSQVVFGEALYHMRWVHTPYRSGR
jgi:hypothetical protein